MTQRSPPTKRFAGATTLFRGHSWRVAWLACPDSRRWVGLVGGVDAAWAGCRLQARAYRPWQHRFPASPGREGHEPPPSRSRPLVVVVRRLEDGLIKGEKTDTGPGPRHSACQEPSTVPAGLHGQQQGVETDSPTPEGVGQGADGVRLLPLPRHGRQGRWAAVVFQAGCPGLSPIYVPACT